MLQFWPITCNFFVFEKRHETCHDMPSQCCLWLACPGSTQMLHRVGGSLCQWSYGPEHASPPMAIFAHVHVGCRCIYRHDPRVHVFMPKCLKFLSCWPKKVSFCSLKNKTWVESHISAGMWIFCWIIFCFIYTYVDLFNAELKEYNEYKAVAEASNSFTNYCQAELHVVLQAMLAK